MSIRYSYPIYLSALLLLLAACTQDEPADDTRLPEGQYPLQIAAVTLSVEGGEAQPWGAPQTRVSETEDGTGSKWDGDEKIGVQIDGKDETGIYIVQDNNTVKADAPLYWTNTTPNRTVSAWYPATDGTLDLRDQETNGLAYLLHGTGTGDYRTSVELTFTHQLAKVRVTPTGDALGEVQSLQLYTYTQCTYEKGEVVQGSQEGWIEMKKCEYTDNGNAITCWEANVVPGYTITKLMANNDNKERDLSAAITPEAGSYYNITLNYDPGYTIEDDGSYTVYTANGLKEWAEAVQTDPTLNITLTADINLTGEAWTPIGSGFSSNTGYQGTFDGQGHSITGLTITTNTIDGENAALFDGIGSDGTVKNLQLVNVSHTVQQNGAAGGIANSNYGTITACSVKGDITASSGDIGGIATFNNGSIIGCWFDGILTTNYAEGGIAVYNYGSVTACFYGGNAGQGVYSNQGETAKTTKVNDGDSWQTAVDGMNNALTSNDYKWELGANNLPVLEKNQ